MNKDGGKAAAVAAGPAKAKKKPSVSRQSKEIRALLADDEKDSEKEDTDLKGKQRTVVRPDTASTITSSSSSGSSNPAANSDKPVAGNTGLTGSGCGL